MGRVWCVLAVAVLRAGLVPALRSRRAHSPPLVSHRTTMVTHRLLRRVLGAAVLVAIAGCGASPSTDIRGTWRQVSSFEEGAAAISPGDALKLRVDATTMRWEDTGE